MAGASQPLQQPSLTTVLLMRALWGCLRFKFHGSELGNSGVGRPTINRAFEFR